MSRRPPAGPDCGRDLWAYLAGDLPAAPARAVARHLASCADCRRLADRIAALRDACRRAGCEPMPADVTDRARRRAREVMASGRPAATARAPVRPRAASRRRR
ncbi:MAG: anti-sigma factor [Vicinamibacterales bacterium]